MSEKPVVTTNNGLFPVLAANVQNQQNSRFIVSLYHPVVVLRPGRPEVRILPVAPRAAPYGVLLFLFCMDFMGQKKSGFEQPVPRALRPAGQKRPGGMFLGRGLANLFGRTKKHIAMYFCNAFLVLILCQNSFSNISSAASVYCPFDSRSFLSRFMAVRIRKISSVEKVAFLSAGRESIFSISFPTSCVPCPSALCW